jgi:hypothetical protein
MDEGPRPLPDATPRWERIRWDEDHPMPRIGQRMTMGMTESNRLVVRDVVIVDSRMDFGPGWCQVQVRRT